MDFLDAMQIKGTVTENQMPTHTSSGSYLLDWFYQMGGMRGQAPDAVLNAFVPALGEAPTLALKSAFCLRNVRGGMGERDLFRLVMRWLALNRPQAVRANLHNIPHYGRWDDVLHICLRTPVEDEAVDFVAEALADGDKLCAKWMPREHKSGHRMAIYLARKLGLRMREYRKLLAGNTEVVETLMCQRRWDEITYSHVPSRAFSLYRRAFARHDEKRFEAFLEDVAEGRERIHAGAIFPHEVARPYFKGAAHDPAIDAQWQSLPETQAAPRTLVVADTSGSMLAADGVPMMVSVSLGIYFAERLTGPFQDTVCTFSAQPRFVRLTGDLQGRVGQALGLDWGMNTNLEAVFELILTQARRHHLAAEQMPDTVLIISDMQFDQCIRNGDDDALEMMGRIYADAGYAMPDVIFWNVRTSQGVPARQTDSGVALLSGYSPALMSAVLEGVANPRQIMLRTLNDPQYDRVVV